MKRSHHSLTILLVLFLCTIGIATRAQQTQPATLPTTLPATLPTTPESVPSADPLRTPDTFFGFLNRDRLVTSGRPLERHEWTFTGQWRLGGERIFIQEGRGKIIIRFDAAKVRVNLQPGSTPISAIVRLDGNFVPHEKSGKDLQEGKLDVNERRFYEIIQLQKREEHTLEIEFLSPGVSVYSFIFG